MENPGGARMPHLSVKTKMTMAVTVLTAVLLTTTAFVFFHFFRQEMRATISRQQFTLVSALAEEIDGKIRTARDHLAAIAEMVGPEILSDPLHAREFLERQRDNQLLFNRGLFLFDSAGSLQAAVPAEPQACQGDCTFLLPWVEKTTAASGPLISEPVLSPHPDLRPLLLFTAPVLARDGTVMGILAGGIDLFGNDLLGHLAQIRLGESGYVYLFNRERTLIAHPDRDRILTRQFPPGANPLIDEVVEGFEGTGETMSIRGYPVLSSFRRLQATGWILAANYPLGEAYASLGSARRFFLVTLVAFIGLTALTVWWLMRVLTAPLADLKRQILACPGSGPPSPVRIATRDEIEEVAGAFNQMTRRLAEHEKALNEQLHFLQVLIDAMPSPIFYKDPAGRYLGCNRAFEGYIGIPRGDLLGKSVYDIDPPDLAEIYFRADAGLFRQGTGKTQVYETSVLYADGVRHEVIFLKATFPTPEGDLGGLVGTLLDITDRKRAEVELAEQKRFSENLLQNAAIAGFVLDGRHQVVAWNRACEFLTGIRAEDVLGTDQHWRAFYPQSRPCLADLVIDGRIGEIPQFYENSGPSPLVPEGWQAEGWRALSRQQSYLMFNASPIRNGQGEIVAAIQTLEDITDRRQTEENLARSFSLLQATLDSTADGILVVSLEGKIVSYNRRFAEMWRLPEEILISGKDDEALRFIQSQLKDPEIFLSRVRELYAHPDRESRDTILFADGRIFDRFSMPQHLQDRIVGRVWSFRDVTRQEQALNQLRKLSLAVEQSPNIVVITDPEGRIEYTNPRFTEVTGYTPEEALGQNPRILKGGDTPEEYYRTLWQTITFGGEWRGEFHNRKKNGDRFWENALISPLKNAEGAITHFVAVKEDVTGKKLSEQRQKLRTQVLELLSLPSDRTGKIQDVLQTLMDFTGVEGIAIRLQEGDGFPYHHVRGIEEFLVAAENLLRLEVEPGHLPQCLCGQVLLNRYDDLPHFTSGGSFWMNRQDDLAAHPCSRGECFRKGFQSMALIPLRSGERVIGLVQLVDRRPGLLSPDLVQFLEEIAVSLGISFGSRQAETRLQEKESRLHFLTNFDPLTQLPNRTLLRDRLLHAMAKARRSGENVAFLLLDLDRFKTINDSLGHEVGDRLLVEVAARLRTVVREGDTLAHFSGDEFAVILEEVGDGKGAMQVAQKMLSHLSQVITLEEYELYLTGSIGITLFPNDAQDLESLLKYAEVAMYRAKELGRNNYQFYRPEMTARSRELLLLEGSLRQALEKGETVLHYQPLIDLTSGRMVAAEALVRWRHPQLGMVSPADFIPLAEETGLIVPIGEWILRTACRQIRAWQEKCPYPLRVAVNISGRQFKEGNFSDLVGQILHETGADPHLLELEITESLLMEKTETTIETFARLKALGVHLAIDDFGTGYSSLGYLKRFPIDCLKIDRSFIREVAQDANDAAIAFSIIALAHAMGLRVVAEGIETEDQLRFLTGKGCDLGQGYLFSRPRPPEELAGLFVSEFLPPGNGCLPCSSP